jgi:hypothetical protein
MYLARSFIHNRLHYLLRESFCEDGIYRHRDVVDLGADPGRFIVYPGGSSFYIADDLFDLAEQAGFSVDHELVEPFFIPFLDPYIKNRVEPFLNRTANRRWKRMDDSTRQRIFQETHVFDRRRIHFLRFGQTDLRELDRSPALYKILLDKSRDELEQLILEREQDLRPQEYKRYIFAVFDLQRHFKEACARTMPHALDGDTMDTCFLKELCNLDRDTVFWQGMDRADGLVSYMIRYVIMFFDYSFPDGQSWDEFVRSHLGGTHRSAPSRGTRRMSMREVTTVFGVKQTTLAAMTRSELVKLYRKMAQTMHPDKGGDHEAFIELTTAYNELLRTKP